MTGTVALLNPSQARAAILTDDGEHTIIEMLDNISLSLGDNVSGSLKSVGKTVIITNDTAGFSGRCFIDDTGQDRQTAIQALKA